MRPPRRRFIPRREMRSIPNMGSIAITQILILGQESYMTLSNSLYYGDLFFPWKCFIPRREMRSISRRSPIVFTCTLFVLVNVYCTFKSTYHGDLFFSRPTSRLNWYHQIKRFRKKKRDKPYRFLNPSVPLPTQNKT